MNRTELKQELQRAGKWAAFVDERDRLKADGATPGEARERALLHVLGDGAHAETGVSEAGRRSTPGFTVPTSRPGLPHSARRSVVWVAENLSVEHVAVDGAPDSQAVSMLNWARSGPGAQSAFWDIWAKTVPTPAQLETESRFADDGRTQFAILDQFAETCDAERDTG